MASILYFVISVFISLFSFNAYAESSAKLESYLSNFQSMSADFTQNVISKKGPGKTSSGHMALQRPGKFRWEIASPSHEIIIADGNYLWIYNADLEQATKQKLDKGNNSPASLLSGDTKSIESRFNIINQKSEDGKDVFQLKPRSDKDMIQWIELHFMQGKMNKMVVVDNLGQKTLFNFTEIQLNPNLAAKLFKFQPPPHVDIIQN